jgi:hypothetical protein
MDSAPVIERVVETYATPFPRSSPSQLNLVPPPPPRVTTRGRWSGGSGCEYDIYQVGASATISEICAYRIRPWDAPTVGITAYGKGAVKGDVFSFTYTAVDGTTGTIPT